MLTFFRRIRKNLMTENRISKYLLYAFGEIVLVVIGILIALQINNWNEDRKAREVEVTFLRGVVEDLRSDSARFQTCVDNLSNIHKFHLQIHQVAKGTLPIDSISRLYTVRVSSSFEPVLSASSPPRLNLLLHSDIRDSLQSYLTQVKTTRVTHDELVKAIKGRLRINLADHGIHDVDAWFEFIGSDKSITKNAPSLSLIKKAKLEAHCKEESFRQILFEVSLKVNESKGYVQKLLIRNAQMIKLLERNIYSSE